MNAHRTTTQSHSQKRLCRPQRNRVLNNLLVTTLCSAVLSFSSVAYSENSDVRTPESTPNKVTKAQACHDVSVQVLGSGGPELDDGRTSSAYIVWVDDSARILVDAGSGSSVQFGASGALFDDIQAIVLSHLHTDHAADVPSFVKGSFFTSRNNDLPIFGPQGNDVMPDTSTYLKTLLGSHGAYRYLSSYTKEGQDDYTIRPTSVSLSASLQSPFTVSLNDAISLEALSVHHGPIPALAWKVKVNGCEVVFSGDTNDKANTLAEFANGADLLVLHNAIDDNAGGVAKNLHMTPKQLIAIATQSKAKRILLSHIMKRSEPGLAALNEAITVVAPGRVYSAVELMNITLDQE